MLARSLIGALSDSDKLHPVIGATPAAMRG